MGPSVEERARNRGSQPLLWSVGVSGDWPILLASIDSTDGLPTLRQLLAAHRYWRRRGMLVDLVVLDTHPPSYIQHGHDRIMAAVLHSGEAGVRDQPGGIFVRRADLLAPDALLMLRATARVHLKCDGQSLGRTLEPSAGQDVEEETSGATAMPRLSERSTPQVVRAIQRITSILLDPLSDGNGARTEDTRTVVRRTPSSADPAKFDPPDTSSLLLGNGLGGLTPEGDYEIRLVGADLPPAPWVNVIANRRGGLVVSERGAGFTWAENSFFYRLTPWHNDPVSDPVSDVLYLRDEDSGDLWSATPAPIRHASPYTVRHGAGSSTFEHEHTNIATHLTLGVAPDEPVKLALLRLTNTGNVHRRITVTSYVEWTLGVQREHTRNHVQTAFDATRRAIVARNTFEPTFAERLAFCAMSEPVSGHTADRREFLGRNGTAAAPLALQSSEPLAGRSGVAMDPCAALQCTLVLAPGEMREVAVALGAGANEADALRLAETYGDVARAREAQGRTVDEWRRRLSVIEVRTPEPSLDAMINRWSLYQALACRMWARSALYQSSGAYGFRDQLQDCMAFVYAEPAVAREHILRAAARQFVEGDVQHWWHPHSGRGVRTRFSDDLVWLPYVVDHYVRVTGDASVLDEMVPFLTMRPLGPDEHELYDLPQVTDERATVYEHCLRALRQACTTGTHGLPLIGIGDWNDGMNRVGVHGRGESVWLAWFLTATIRRFVEHVERRGEVAMALGLRTRADAYAAAVEREGWDGAWYRRAYFDDGTPLGSAQNDECRIDSIAQSWSVISGAGDPARQRQAMRSFEEHLVREDARLLMLLTPPFDHTPNDPGYIKGYLPGVRENGAQYTHAALWSVLATALLGDGDRAFELFQMINPLTHSRTRDEIAVYQAEPYVVAADVYTAQGKLGRGGWTWYTGSASWLYRIGLETLLGFEKRGDTLTVRPHLPREWPGFSIDYRFGGSTYRIEVELVDATPSGRGEVSVDGRTIESGEIPLVDDGAEHRVRVRTGRG
jgi:cyclic beta-1,2-glucan synthetase